MASCAVSMPATIPTGGRALNFADRPGDVSAAFRPEVWERLLAIKRQHDPGDLFVAAHQVG
jgi:hypothetical protein